MLEHFLVSQVFAFFLIFCRVGSGLMVIPGIAESYVPKRIRLTFALFITLILTPMLGTIMPPLPASAAALGLLVIAEIIIGLFIGTICNIIIGATHVAGMIFSLQAGVSSAVIYDVTQSSQGSLAGNFLGLVTLVLLFSTNLHHLMLRGITDSYTIFLPGTFPPVHAFIETSARMLADTFVAALQICTPFIVAGTVLFIAGGVLSRLMPTIQIFFVITPVQLLLGFFILMTGFSGIMLWYLQFYSDKLSMFLGYAK